MELEERIHRIQKGEQTSFEWMVDEYKNKIYAIAYGYAKDAYMAQDLTQDILIKVHQNIACFQGQSAFSTWLYRVAKNQCIDWIRKNKKTMKNTSLEDGKWRFQDQSLTPEEETIREERKAMLHDAIGQLPEKYRTPLLLFHFQELSYDEIAKVLQLPSKTIATHLYRGKKILRKKLISKGRGDLPWTAL